MPNFSAGTAADSRSSRKNTTQRQEQNGLHKLFLNNASMPLFENMTNG
jgi:hypothetical protein